MIEGVQRVVASTMYVHCPVSSSWKHDNQIDRQWRCRWLPERTVRNSW